MWERERGKERGGGREVEGGAEQEEGTEGERIKYIECLITQKNYI